MLSVDSLLLELDLNRGVGFYLCRLASLVQFARVSLMLFFVLRYPLLDALSDKACLLLGLARSLSTLGDLHRFIPRLG